LIQFASPEVNLLRCWSSEVFIRGWIQTGVDVQDGHPDKTEKLMESN